MIIITFYGGLSHDITYFTFTTNGNILYAKMLTKCYFYSKHKYDLCPFETHFLILWAQAHSKGFLTPRPSHDFPVSRPEQASGGLTLTITGKSWAGILECGVERN